MFIIIFSQNRFPPWFAHEYQRVNTKSYTHEINVIPNVTHVLPMIKGNVILILLTLGYYYQSSKIHKMWHVILISSQILWKESLTSNNIL